MNAVRLVGQRDNDKAGPVSAAAAPTSAMKKFVQSAIEVVIGRPL
jgi:hypothetical protein